MLRRREYLQCLATMLVAAPAYAQSMKVQRRESWPTQSVNLIVPFPAGGSSAILAKQLSQAFERATQQPLRLQYLGGGGGLQGANFAAKAVADGQNLFIGGSHLAMARALMPDGEFDLIEDLRPLALVAKIPQVVVVNPLRIRARTAMEWLAELSRKPKRYRMATAGVGSSSHISAEILKHQEVLIFDFVHFRGAGPALQDLLAGSVDMMIDGLISCLPYIRSGQLRPLIVTGTERVSVLPDVPCAHELGVDALNRVMWYGLFAPSQLPEGQSKAIQQVFQRLENDQALQANFESLGIRWGGVYGEAFEAQVQQETLSWAQHLKEIGLQKQWGQKPEESGV